MADSAKVNITIDSNYQNVNTPGKGIVYVLGPTKRGPVNDPSELIFSWPQFERTFGGLIPTSDFPLLAKRILEYGAKLRVNRIVNHTTGVPNAVKAAFPSAGAIVNSDGTPATVFTAAVKNHGADYNNISLVISAASNGDATYFNMAVNHALEPGLNELYENLKIEGAYAVTALHFLDEVNKRGKLLTFTYVNLSTGVTSLRPVNATYTATGGTDGSSIVDADYVGSTSYKNGLYAFDNYTDGSFIGVPEISTDTVNEGVAAYVANRKDLLGMVHFSNSANTSALLLTERTNLSADTPYLSIWGGGLRITDEVTGLSKNISELGDVLGLAAKSANDFGEWYSFSEKTRGTVRNCLGVVNNFGTTAASTELDALARAQVNMVITRDGVTYLKGNLTSQKANNPQKFISIMSLLMFIQSTVRPVLEGYLEEPCDIPTFKKIFYHVKPFFDGLMTEDKRALWNYSWQGDQGAKDLDSLQINVKEDVLLGKYRIRLKLIPIAPLREINLNITLDTTVGSTSVSIA